MTYNGHRPAKIAVETCGARHVIRLWRIVRYVNDCKNQKKEVRYSVQNDNKPEQMTYTDHWRWCRKGVTWNNTMVHKRRVGHNSKNETSCGHPTYHMYSIQLQATMMTMKVKTPICIAAKRNEHRSSFFCNDWSRYFSSEIRQCRTVVRNYSTKFICTYTTWKFQYVGDSGITYRCTRGLRPRRLYGAKPPKCNVSSQVHPEHAEW